MPSHPSCSSRLLLLIGLLITAALRSPASLQDGDLVFQDSQSSQCEAVKLATKSPFSHVGLVFFRNQTPYVLEAIQPVVATPLDQWIRRGSGESFVVKRLKDADTILTPQAVEKLRKAAFRYFGKTYDWLFHWSDDQIYCSELVWKAYERGLGIRLCQPRTLRDFDLSHPAVQKKLTERYGTAIPWTEPVVAPSDLFGSELLVTVEP